MMSNDKEITQKAEGKFIAQADRGGIAVVNVTSSDSMSEIDKRHRNDMLRKVENRVEQKLHASLYKDRAIDIQLGFCHDLVDYTDEAEQKIIRDISVAFDATEGRLLIVGEPGAGKTILLYTLGRILIKRASQEESNAIPVILNLSSWSSSRANFKEWVVEELFNKYDVSGNLARKWIDGNMIAFLLDGFDEVSNDIRIDCIASINEFRSNYHVQMVVCSREQEYVSLGTHLMLQGAVIALSLTDEQIYSQLSFEELRGLREVIKVDSVLYDLAHTPLFIDIMSRSYGDLQSGDILNKLSSQTFPDNNRIIDIYKW